MNEALATVKAKGLRVHYLMDLGNGWWRAILGADTDMKWADGETPGAALSAAIEQHESAVDFLA